ncbi:MAG: response regulator [Deltaproteobacteria bacterium]
MPQLMIVDDELDVREYLKNYFRRRKIEVQTAENGEKALELIQESQPDLVLLDVRMIGIDGVETLRRIRASGNNVPVIMVTGVEDQTIIDALLALHVEAVIHKPLILDELEKEVLQRLVAK